MEFKIFLDRYHIYDPNLQKLGMAVDKVLINEFIKCFTNAHNRIVWHTKHHITIIFQDTFIVCVRE